jgi:acetyltransferase-like isoleucine patch superfamily enzyme
VAHRLATALLLVLLRALRRLVGLVVVDRFLLVGGAAAAVLRAFGARVDEPTVLHCPLVVHNAEGGYANLSIGANVHVGKLCLLDLTGPLAIERDCTVSMGTTILTHVDVGSAAAREDLPRAVRATRIGAGAYLGANVTVLAGCDVGAGAVVGAGALVSRPVAAGERVAGVPARPLP